MGVSWSLKERCRAMSLRELTRPMVRGNDPQKRYEFWQELQRDPLMIAAADVKLNGMSNMELLDLIGEALANDG